MSNENIFEGMEDWRLLPLRAIISTKKQRGFLPVSATTFLNLVKRGLLPQGRQIFGRTRFWSVGEIKNFSKKFAGGVIKSE